MATGTLVVTYTVGVQDGKDAVITGLTIDGTAIASATAIEKTRAWVCSKGVVNYMTTQGYFPLGVGSTALTA
jgi:hypothetical protein